MTTKSPASLLLPCAGVGVMTDQLFEWEERCELTFSGLNTRPVPGSEFALSNVSGVVKPGQILAVMGQTGGGKTTLLNALSGRLRLESGTVCINGESICKRVRRTKVGYVLQQDVFFASLTLKQTLVYTALLRLPDRKFSKAEKLQKVEDIIYLLDLHRCQHTPVGDEITRGLSGGEKKRLSIACELITNPSVLLIDEPTSGLDSCTATNLMITLKEFAMKTCKNVILTVHQPSSRIFQMFDSLLLLCNGQTAYFGQANQIVPHLTNLGLHIQPHYNPADFLLEQLKVEEKRILVGWSPYVNNNIISSKDWKNSDDTLNTTWQTSFFTQVQVLTGRNIRLALPRLFSKVNVIQTLILAIMAGLVWFQIERKEERLMDLEGWMFFSSNYWMLFVLFNALWAFPIERPVVEKERMSGSYRLSAYYIAKIIGEAPLEMVLPSVYLTISYPFIGGTFAAFGGILLAQILSSTAAQSVGLFFGSVLGGPAATTTAAVFTLAAQLLGGYLANNIPSYLKIFSLVYNGLRNMQILEFQMGLPIQCGNPSQFPSCNILEKSDFGTTSVSDFNALTPRYVSPEDLLSKDKASFVFPYWSHTLYLLSFIVIFRVLCYVALRR